MKVSVRVKNGAKVPKRDIDKPVYGASRWIMISPGVYFCSCCGEKFFFCGAEKWRYCTCCGAYKEG